MRLYSEQTHLRPPIQSARVNKQTSVAHLANAHAAASQPASQQDSPKLARHQQGGQTIRPPLAAGLMQADLRAGRRWRDCFIGWRAGRQSGKIRQPYAWRAGATAPHQLASLSPSASLSLSLSRSVPKGGHSETDGQTDARRHTETHSRTQGGLNGAIGSSMRLHKQLGRVAKWAGRQFQVKPLGHQAGRQASQRASRWTVRRNWPAAVVKGGGTRAASGDSLR